MLDTISTVLFFAVPFGAFLYLIGRDIIFKDTMNRFQMFPWWDLEKRKRVLYWITKDDRKPHDPMVGGGFFKFTAWPWVAGRGIQFARKQYTFQIGIGRLYPDLPRDPDDPEVLLHLLEGKELAMEAKHFRNPEKTWRLDEDGNLSQQQGDDE